MIADDSCRRIDLAAQPLEPRIMQELVTRSLARPSGR
jgi:hypothetical protein